MTVSSNRKYIFMLAVGCFGISMLIYNEKLIFQRKRFTASSKYMSPCSVLNPNVSRNSSEKKLLVLCIFSKSEGLEKRRAARNSWISTMHQWRANLPFRIIYKFILSSETEDTLEENMITEDIIFLNKKPKSKGVINGDMLYTLIRNIHRTYENATLVRIDDDVFVCVPEIFIRIAEIFSTTMYYGYKYGAVDTVSEHQPIDEMFVVLGANLVRRIANRHFCHSNQCLPEELIGLYYGSNSLANWLSIYNDIKIIADNKRIIHFLGKSNYSDQVKPYIQHIKEDFCIKYLIFHKASIEVMNQLADVRYKMSLQPFTKHNPKQKDKTSVLLATTGSLFSGKVKRPLFKPFVNTSREFVMADTNRNCSKWAVVTTIFTFSSSVKHIMNSQEWCIVIVADEKTPKQSTYFKNLNHNFDKKYVKYLSLTEQRTLYPALSETLPVNSFSRKNIGYMYAIHHQADLIWDFDDDNYGIIDVSKITSSAYVTACTNFKSNIINPYPFFGVKDSRTWPRGLPLQKVKSDKINPEICNLTKPLNIGILQSLANGQPDVDAIYRLTREVPFNFSATTETHPGLVIPLGAFSPFNGQATLWFKDTFRFLALPVSVNGRVSDIWRSYFAQFFMHKDRIHLAFTPPFVYQERNPHTIITDFNGELDLYQKSAQLIDFLSTLKTTTQFSLSKLYDMLYVRHYLNDKDMNFIAAWEKTLNDVYKLESKESKITINTK